MQYFTDRKKELDKEFRKERQEYLNKLNNYRSELNYYK